MAKGFKDSIETIRDNAETIFATPSYVQELKPYQLEELRNYAKTIKRELLKKYGLEDSGITTISEYMNANPFPELEDCEKWNYAERIEAIPGVLRQEDEPKGTGAKIIIPKGSRAHFFMAIDAFCEMGFFVKEGANQKGIRKAVLTAIAQALGESFSTADQSIAAAYDAKNEATNTDFLIAIADVIRRKREAKLEGGKNK